MTFDFLFTGLLWVISVIVSVGTGGIEEALREQVIEYNYKQSMFDVVVSNFSIRKK